MIGKEGHRAWSTRPGGAETESEIGYSGVASEKPVLRMQACVFGMTRTHDGRSFVVRIRGWERILRSCAGDPGPKEAWAPINVRGVLGTCRPGLGGLRLRPLRLFPSWFSCPSAWGFEWRWYQLASGSSKREFLALTRLEVQPPRSCQAHLCGLGFLFHSFQSYQGRESFWPLGDTREAISSGLWGLRPPWLRLPIHSGTWYPPGSQGFSVEMDEARGRSILGAWTRPLLPSTARWRAGLP